METIIYTQNGPDDMDAEILMTDEERFEPTDVVETQMDTILKGIRL